MAERTWVIREEIWGFDSPQRVLVVSRGSDGVADSEGPAFFNREQVNEFIQELQAQADQMTTDASAGGAQNPASRITQQLTDRIAGLEQALRSICDLRPSARHIKHRGHAQDRNEGAREP